MLKPLPRPASSTSESKIDLPAYLFSVRDAAHFTHIYQKDNTLATHLALADYYEGLIGLVDEFTECYSGLYGKQKISIPSTGIMENPAKDLMTVYETIESKRKAIKESFLQNIIDEIQALNARTLYKLKFVQ